MKRLQRWVRVLLSTLLLVAVAFVGYEILESPANQTFGRTLVHGPQNQKIVALTYDDGPNPPYTDRILDVLDAEHVHATFFLVGRAVAAYPQTVRREVASGNALGNHSWDHRLLIVMTPGAVRRSLERTDDAIFASTGTHTHIMRPPFGSRDWLVLGEARHLGYTPVMWSVPLAKDWEDPPATVIANRILPYVANGSIIVLHDGNRGILCSAANAPICDRSSDIEATKIIVQTLKSRGYRFVTIPELLATHTSAHPAE